VRRIVERGTAHLGNSWASHTFNEVFVGGRWRRLNFDRLGQNVLDPQMFGLLVHVATFKDWADGDMASTWGLRQSTKDRTNDPLGGSNPYSAITLSDRFGEHANIDNPPPPDAYTKLTIDAAWWFDQCPAEVKMRLDDPDSAGHVVVRVAEGRAGEGPQQYKEFYDRVGKKFVLKAKGKPDIPIRADRGYWAKPEEGLRHFYLRIEPKDFERMAVNVPYALKAVGKKDQTHRWAVKKGVTLTRRKGGTAVAKATRKKEAPEADGVPDEITIDEIAWSDGPDSPTGPLEGQSRPVLLLRVGKQSEFDAFKRFSELADRRFFLEADGHPTLKVGAVIGGVTTPEHSYAIIELGPADWNDLVEGVEYTLRPQNSNADHRWRLAGRPRVRR
jgi:hypothetical protein